MTETKLFGFLPMGWFDVIDIMLVAVLIYQLYKLVKGTAAIKIFFGILAIFLLWKVVGVLQMDLLSEILGQFISVGVIALIIVFQQEVRRFLLLIGNTDLFSEKGAARQLIFWNRNKEQQNQLDIDSLVRACSNMASTRTGALIVIAKMARLENYVESGTAIDATLSSEIIETLFFKNSPLHDGAIIIRENSVVAGSCILPVSENKDLPKETGMRHRAAVGVTEDSDAIAIVVSEQTGLMSVAREGRLEKLDSALKLKALLREALG